MPGVGVLVFVTGVGAVVGGVGALVYWHRVLAVVCAQCRRFHAPKTARRSSIPNRTRRKLHGPALPTYVAQIHHSNNTAPVLHKHLHHMYIYTAHHRTDTAQTPGHRHPAHTPQQRDRGSTSQHLHRPHTAQTYTAPRTPQHLYRGTYKNPRPQHLEHGQIRVPC